MAKKFTEEEIIRLESIIKKDDNEWAPLLKEVAKETDRTYGSVWQKAYAMSQGGDAARRKKAKKKPGPKSKGAHTKKVTVKKAKVKGKTPKRKSHKSPLDSNYMTVSPNEVRFPIQGIRIEGGELIVTFK